MTNGYRYGNLRFWEMFPGLMVWGTFSLAFVLSFLAPKWVIVFIIVFDLLWLFRVLYFNFFVLLSWLKYKKTMKTDWQSKLVSFERAIRIHHLVFLPTYKESYTIVRDALRSLQTNSFPNERIIVVLGGEAGDKEAFEKISNRALREFASTFKDLIVTLHPNGLPDEIPGKGSNMNWMGREVEKHLHEKHSNIADEDIIVSAFDIDTIAHPQYFSYLTYLYCTVEKPERSSYQPIALFSNNIWTAPAPVRIGAFGTTFWLFGELTRPERLWTFSSHSMPWKMLRDVGFWQKDIVSEDSRVFMQAFLHYHGDYRVTPMFLPVSMDAVKGENYRDSLKALYGQMRRWAWGVEHLPYIIDGFKRDPLIPKIKKARYIFNHIEGMYTWATAPITMFVLGWLPLWVAKDGSGALVQSAPYALESLMQLAMVGILISAVMSLALLPRRPQDVKPRTWVVMFAQWVLLPISFIVFGSFPAIDAQTRLMLGKYLGFNVTKKTRG